MDMLEFNPPSFEAWRENMMRVYREDFKDKEGIVREKGVVIKNGIMNSIKGYIVCYRLPDEVATAYWDFAERIGRSVPILENGSPSVSRYSYLNKGVHVTLSWGIFTGDNLVNSNDIIKLISDGVGAIVGDLKAPVVKQNGLLYQKNNGAPTLVSKDVPFNEGKSVGL